MSEITHDVEMSPTHDVEMSPTVGAIFGAMAKAQAKLEGAKKDAENPHLKSKYADLASVWEAVKAALPSFELCVVQLTRENRAGSDAGPLVWRMAAWHPVYARIKR